MTSLPSTPSQTVGPYLHIGLTWADGQFAVPPGTPGAVWLTGRVRDGAGTAIDDAMVETWQAIGNAPGTERTGFARSDTRRGAYAIHTLVPEAVCDGAGGLQAPHLDMSVFARGLLHRVVTRVYFPEHADRHPADPVLATVPPARRHTLIAQREGDGYVFDIRLQGADETVFFDV
ncbi:protocatechuate 3,4-dioxygenase subunit alpha [Nocardia brasiliensis]|uniref:Protocatechuate 3,4-dioxygenase subunit alpha n=1 Tax=Nocardia brasiliensis TaxID=37326 RepID=A0A6G9XT99_NOCBR|nr:protocatechuate 3,4-dioxygenase subunit alpha [Nocardia brasiliensis]QIS04139.1 protocatechuate 3,4-dioxygenase subunit alpha [Nocardia brasiliensis]